ncbi:hypothetical protein FHS09_000884 [Microbulbifer rhizosphaerae]|uniref:Uncharacterized protein n=1 Tax=Microbulbifer rhizosphaerae TaxID=1562603 RepID=A0A7W4Z814_9GAMM|nr:hypothetical protein [Microbulbifer rhizosphaerae]
MAILVTDTAIWTMDNEFGLLVACNIPRSIYCLLLRVTHGGSSLVASAFDSPTVLMRNNMLIFSGHDGSPIVDLWKSQPVGWVVNGRPL